MNSGANQIRTEIAANTGLAKVGKRINPVRRPSLLYHSYALNASAKVSARSSGALISTPRSRSRPSWMP